MVGPMAQKVTEQDIRDKVAAASEEGFAEVYAVPDIVVKTEAEKDINARGVAFDYAEANHDDPSDIPGDAQYEKDKAAWDTVNFD